MLSIKLIGLGLALSLASASWAQVTQRVSVSSAGVPGNDDSGRDGVSISADGRYVAFWSDASNLVPGDTNGKRDVFVRDRLIGTTERVSVASDGTQGDGHSGSYGLTISADGRYVAFDSAAANLALGDSTGDSDMFVRDRLNGTTELVSFAQAHQNVSSPSISADGRYVAFGVDGSYVLVYDRTLGSTEVASVGMPDPPPGHGPGTWWSYSPSISADGQYVAFSADYEEPLSGVPSQIFVRDRVNGTTEQLSMGANSNYDPSISPDGRYVAAAMGAYALGVFDRQTGALQSISALGASSPSISADGRYVAYETAHYYGGTQFDNFIYVWDRQSGTNELVCGGNDVYSRSPSLSSEGRYVAFSSGWNNLVPGDTNGAEDVFVRNRTGGTRFTSLCDPGVGAVTACPCSNPPNGSGRGCDNSSGTGGAMLSATGGAYLSSDSLVFTTSGEKPTATSIVLQGNGQITSGAVFGQGVRCAGGSLKRLYVKSASGGSITAPDFDAGDPSVSARSTALGDPIQAGESRWHLVYYRDPSVLGGCPSSSTFNASQTGKVTWGP